MKTLYVNFANAAQAAVESYFASGPGDSALYSNQGTVTTDDPIWKTYYDSFPPNMQEGLPAPTAS